MTLRPAIPADSPWLEIWDEDEGVIVATTDDRAATAAFGVVWPEELAAQSAVSRYYLAEVQGRPIGAMQIIDPHLEPTHYWGEIAPNLRAVDIWIGAAADRGRGYGTAMMREALALCFSDPRVTGVVIDPLTSNARAHRFYERLGFKVVGPRRFGSAECLVHELTRAAWHAYERGSEQPR